MLFFFCWYSKFLVLTWWKIDLAKTTPLFQDYDRKINKYKDLIQLQPPGTKFFALAIESLGGTHPEVRNFLLQLAKCASRFWLLSTLQSNASFVAYHAKALSVRAHVGTAKSILNLAKKANTTLQLAAGTSFNTTIPL